MYWLFIFCWLVCFTILNIVTKMFVQTVPWPPGNHMNLIQVITSSPWPYIMVLLYVLCAALYMICLKYLPLSIAGPAILVLGTISTFAVGILLWKEPIVRIKVVGNMLCILGIILMLLPDNHA